MRKALQYSLLATCFMVSITVFMYAYSDSFHSVLKIEHPKDIQIRNPFQGVKDTVEHSPGTRSLKDVQTNSLSITVQDTVDKQEAKSSLKLLCFITTQKHAIHSKIRALNATWARRCDKVLYVISKEGSEGISGPDILKLDVPDGRDHLTAKSMHTFTYLYKNYLHNYTWFLKGDDDTYIIVENLKRLLSLKDSNSSITLGHYFKMHAKGGYGYHSGGASYVLSRKALQGMVEKGISVKGQCREDGGDEDVEVQACLLKTGALPHKSIDKLGRETFHPESYKDYMVGPMWAGAKVYSRHEPKEGPECCSELLISFHRMTPDLIYLFDQLLYRTSVYGLNRDKKVLDELLTDESEPKM